MLSLGVGGHGNKMRVFTLSNFIMCDQHRRNTFIPFITGLNIGRNFVTCEPGFNHIHDLLSVQGISVTIGNDHLCIDIRLVTTRWP